MQLVLPLAPEVGAYNSVWDLAWKAAVRMGLNQEGRKNDKKQSCSLVMSRSLDQTMPAAHSKSEKLIS